MTGDYRGTNRPSLLVRVATNRNVLATISVYDCAKSSRNDAAQALRGYDRPDVAPPARNEQTGMIVAWFDRYVKNGASVPDLKPHGW